MKIRNRIGGLLASMTALAALTTAPAEAAACPSGWGSTPERSWLMSQAPLTAAVTGRHTCYDRVVFTFRGGARGYDARYATNVYSDGQGQRLSIRGGAKIAVTLLAPAHDQNYRPTYNRRVNEKVANVTGYATLRDLVYGGSFEGQTTFGVGVRARLPFRVWTINGPGTSSRIVLDVRHSW